MTACGVEPTSKLQPKTSCDAVPNSPALLALYQTCECNAQYRCLDQDLDKIDKKTTHAVHT